MNYATAIFVLAVLAVLAGCQQGKQEICPDGGGELTAAPQQITEERARQIAADYVNSFLKGKTYKVNGREYAYPDRVVLAAAWHQVKKTGNGWALHIDPPDGCFAHAEMDLNGENVRVTRYGFSPD